jgi:signal transduction histidine kinase
MNKPESTIEEAESLELLSSVGVALAGSFDFREILQQTHEAATKLLGGGPVDVLYAGRRSINSRPFWFPLEATPEGLSAQTRQRVQDRVERLSERSEQSEGEGRPPALEEVTEGEAMPIIYQRELLGFIFFGSRRKLRNQETRLLSLLALQAATALRNIHLAQERIHFERLSAVGRMIGSLVHDFRSPLTALRGYAGMLSNHDLDVREREEYSRFLIEECDRLDHMVDELLDFTRGSGSETSPRSVDLRGFLERLAERARIQLAGDGIDVGLSLGYDGPALLDAKRIERAIWNVLTNACQAMPKGGCVVLRSDCRNGTLLLEVEDDGAGIPEEIRHRIFEPFFSFGKAEGIGLGMAIAQRIAQEHGGEIQVEERLGGGTRVRFVLPARGQEEIALAATRVTGAK